MLQSYKMPVLFGFAAHTALEAESIANQMHDQGVTEFVVKAQIHAGGRGKGHFKNSNL